MMFLRNLLIILVVLIAACEGADRPASSDDELRSESPTSLVVASNYPLYFFAVRIAEGVDLAPEIVLPEIDGDPALWTPSAEQIQLLQSADLVLLNGAGAESWLNLISIDRRRLVDTSVNIEERLIALVSSVQHQHGPEGEHSHIGTAFTTWLDPKLAVAQARVVTEALVRLFPENESQFRENLARLDSELIELDSQMEAAFERFDGRPVLFSHPVYQYLQRRYRINGMSVHWEPDQAPTTSDWIELQQILSKHPASIMIWEDQPLPETEARLAVAGIRSIVFVTVANRPIEGDYISEMRANIKRLEEPTVD
jgi:zinc transport system substrate-binding protein